MPAAPTRTFALSLVVLLASCSGTPTGTLSLVTGDETDVFSRAPAPTTLVVETVAVDGTRKEIARSPLPVDTIQLGDQQRSDAGGIAVTGLDATGKPVVRGESLLVEWGALEDSTLEIFVQRTGEWARMPRAPSAFDALVTTTIAGRYVLAANGTSTLLYDLLDLKPLTSPTLPRPAKSIASYGTAVLVIDETGATTLDLADGTSYATNAPTGGTFAEIAGGQRAVAADGTQYVVGATRKGAGPSARILVVDPDGNVTFAALSTPREGACATYVEGRGLVVYGGADKANGAELLAPKATASTVLPFPADAVQGCAAAALDNAHVAIAGGASAAPVRVFDLACTTDCTPASWPDSIALVRAEAYALAADAALFVGDDASGATHAYRASAAGTREVPLKTPRKGARLVRTAIGAELVVAGGAAGIEQYVE